MEMFRSGTRMEAMCEVAAQWGANQELEACCDWIPKKTPWEAEKLRAARRPKPLSLKEQALSLKEQALTELHAVATRANDTREQHQDLQTLRQALEALPE